MDRAGDGSAGCAIMVGGRSRGSLSIARRFMDAGKPVLPIPFVGGESRNTFEEILRTWAEAPVPGLSQAQFLRLAVPWINDTGPLANLLLGTLAATQDIFISYRRSDGAAPAGRAHADLVDHFGERRVFFDLQGIVPAAQWMPTIVQSTLAALSMREEMGTDDDDADLACVDCRLAREAPEVVSD